MKKYYFLILALVLFGCYADTINKLDTFSIQIPIFFSGPFKDRSVPDTAVDFSNLYKYPEYKDNRDRVNKAEILQLNYRIDSLVYEDGSVFNPLTDNLEFLYVKYSFRFAKSKTGNEQSTNPDDFEPDMSKPLITLGDFQNVKIKDYFKEAKYILDVSETNAKTISDGLKIKPYFYIYTEYSKIKGQTGDEFKFKLIQAKFDVILRLEVNL
jgi:hypothetical protein